MLTMPPALFVNDDALREKIHAALQLIVPLLAIVPASIKCVPAVSTLSVDPPGMVRPVPVMTALFHDVVPVTVSPLKLTVPESSVSPPATVIDPDANAELLAMRYVPLPLNDVPLANELPFVVNSIVVPLSALNTVVADDVVAPLNRSVRFPRQAGYRKLVLWTQSELSAARRLYQAGK